MQHLHLAQLIERKRLSNMDHITKQAKLEDPAPTKAPSTLFPKIDGKTKGFVYELKRLIPAGTRSLPLEGTVKLHGTHADILYDLTPSDLELAQNLHSQKQRASGTENHKLAGVRFQSRNLELTLGSENCGFPKELLHQTAHLHTLKTLLLHRFRTTHPSVSILLSHPLLVAGEWIGSGVQRGVAVAQLTKRLVILSIALNGQWLNDALFADIEIPEAGIYNVRRAGTYKVQLSLENRPLNDDDSVLREMQDRAEQVMACCPFAATFGVEGKGEGVVWKVDEDAWRGETALWFKTKGEGFDRRTTREKMSAEERSKLDGGKKLEKARAKELAEMWVTDRRVEQGFEFLAEKGIKIPGKANVRAFIEWVRDDVLVEERIEIQEAGVQETALKSEISSLASRRFMEALKERDKE